MKTPEEIRDLPWLIIEEESDDGGCGRVFMRDAEGREDKWEGKS